MLSGYSLILCVLFLLLNRLRCGVFHTQKKPLHDTIYTYIGAEDNVKREFLKKLICNICFAAICALLTIIGTYFFGMNRSSVLFGIGLGAFLITWPYIFIYRLYAFWRNPAALVHFLLNLAEIIYAVCISDFFLTWNCWKLLAFLIPIIGGRMRYLTDFTRLDYLEEMSFETKFYTEWKKILLRENEFVKKYGTYIKEASLEYKLPPLFLTRLLLFEYTEHGMWYCSLPKRFITIFFPSLCLRMNLSIGVGLVKPKTVKSFFTKNPNDIIKTLSCNRDNILIVARLVRKFTDEYPGAGNYIPDKDCEQSRFGTIEYDTLGKPTQFCRYILSRYNTGKTYSRFDFIGIGADILLKSDAEVLWKQTKEGKQERT